MDIKRMYISLGMALGLIVTFWPVVLFVVLGPPLSETQTNAAGLMFLVLWAGFYIGLGIEG